MTDITPKPMTPKRRAEIESEMRSSFSSVTVAEYMILTDLLADAAFWRERSEQLETENARLRLLLDNVKAATEIYSDDLDDFYERISDIILKGTP